MKGWKGKVLWIDLTNGDIRKEPLSPDFAKKYIGGRGFNARRLWDLIKPGIDALSPDNVICFAPGLLNGALSGAGTGKMNASAKSPLSDIFGDSSAGGFFGPELKYAGYDQIIIRGKSKNPVYLWIKDDFVEIRNADHLWGDDTWETQKKLMKELGDNRAQVACIGPAGENLVRYACIIHGQKHAFGRTGMGTIMGSKNLKAIAVRGTTGVQVAEPEMLNKISLETYHRLLQRPAVGLLSTYGSSALMAYLNEFGALATRNHADDAKGMFEFADDVTGEVIREKHDIGHRACFACPVHCIPYHVVKEGKYQTFGEGPEYNLIGIFGAKCGCGNLEGLLKIHELLNKYGMDIKDAGGMIAWAMDCYNRGIMTKEDTGGLELRWGDPDIMIELLQQIANNEKFGKILKEGAKRAPKIMGRGSEKFMYHVKGLATISEEPRALRGFCFSWVTSSRGADHLRALVNIDMRGDVKLAKEFYGDVRTADPLSPKGKGKVVAFKENLSAAADAAGVCKWLFVYHTHPSIVADELAKLIAPATGWNISGDQLYQAGERIYNIEKAFNVREGLTRKDDTLPEKFLKEPMPRGKGKGTVFEQDEMLDEYYAHKGWDIPSGLQTKRKLQELGLDDVALELEKIGKLPR